MKKSLLILLTGYILSFALFSNGFSEIKKFDSSDVRDIQVSVYFGNITTQFVEGNEVCIILEASEKKLIPPVVFENNQITVKKEEIFILDKPDICDITICFPKNYIPDSIKFAADLGIIKMENLEVKDSIIIASSDNRNVYKNLKTDYFEIKCSDESDITVYNLDCRSFKINGFVGTINVSLKNAPVIESSIFCKFGKINLSIPKDQNFSINARSFLSKFYNNYAGTTKDWIRDGFDYKHNRSGALIKLQTHEGDITIGE